MNEIPAFFPFLPVFGGFRTTGRPFDQGFLPTVLVYTDKDLVTADVGDDIICTRVVSRQNTGDIILDLVSTSQLSSKTTTTTTTTTAKTDCNESMADSSIKAVRIELPFGKKLHARD